MRSCEKGALRQPGPTCVGHAYPDRANLYEGRGATTRRNPTSPQFLLGDCEQARALGEDTLLRCRRVLGSDHLTTLVTAALLTQALALGAAMEAARALGEDTLQRCRGYSARTTQSP
jgi:hypothetical protein